MQMNKPPGFRTQAGRFCALVLVAAGGTLLYAKTVAPYYRCYINISESLPGRVYLVSMQDRIPQRGALVAFRSPPTPAYPESTAFLKYVAGVPGDLVEIRALQWFVNQRPLGHIKEYARSGRRLAPGPQGRIPAASYAMWSPWEDSYDSRYRDIGWIGAERIIGRADRLF